MKKWLFLLSSTLLVGCKLVIPPTFSENDLVNKKWFCKSSYGMWHILTEEYVEYHPDGTASNYGTLTTQQDGVEFAYKFNISGRWQLRGWYLNEIADKVQLKRAFSKKAQQALRASADLRAWEKAMYKVIDDSVTAAQNYGASREIESLTPTTLTTKAHTSYVICGIQ